MDTRKEKEPTMVGVVTEALPNILFRIMPESGGDEMLAYLSGKMRMNKILKSFARLLH